MADEQQVDAETGAPYSPEKFMNAEQQMSALVEESLAGQQKRAVTAMFTNLSAV